MQGSTMKQRLIMWLAVVAGVVLVLAVAWAAILWTRPEPIRIAFANSLSGPSAPAGTESLVATQLAIDEVNAKGGVNGRPIELVLFDDASNPAVARANAQAIADSPCAAVLGHFLSSTSLAAAPAYKDARIPALTGSAAADDLTSGNEYYFRALTPISTQARSIAEHLRAVMKEPKVRLFHTRDAYGESFVSGFAAAYPLVQWRVFGLDVASGQIGSMDEALDAAGAYDAARLMIEALKRADVKNRSDSKIADRDRVRVAFGAIDSPKSAVAGLTGRLYFNTNRDIPRPIRLGFFRYGRFVTAPLQLVRIDQPNGIDLAAEREKGHVVTFRDRHYWIQRVVYTGIDIIRVNRIDVKQNSFNVDFYLWMRFAGDDEAQTHVEFPALLDRGAFDPARPMQAGQEDGLSYLLYRISGDFKARFDLHDYPFDTQQLRLHFQNTEQRRELITYVIDRFGLRLDDDGSSRAEDGAYSGLQLWRFLGLNYFVESLSSGSTLGKASLFGAEARTEFAGFDAAIMLRRSSAIYMLKNLLPLFLLVLVVFAPLFFPETMFRERVTIPVTSILASAVLLVAVNSQIGDVGYTVVVEEMFYIFFVLCLMTILAGYRHEKLRDAGRKRVAVVLDHVAQVIYAGTVLLVIVVLYRRYAV